MFKGETMSTVNKNYIVKKRNVLNDIRANNMTLQELRFFSIYLSKINPQDLSTRVVRFSMNDFKAIMELGRIDISYIENVTNSLLCKVVNIPLERGGYTAFQLFKECTVSLEKNGEWYVEIDAHDKALPLMFEFQSRFFSYQLWNALRLRSSNQLRMYEILKQYQKIGHRVLTVEDLKALLGIKNREYLRFGNFKERVLDACQQALKKSTDITFTYEPYGKRGKGGKILSLKFIIKKNEDYVDRITLSEFMDECRSNNVEKTLDNEFNSESFGGRIGLLSDACNNEFSDSEIVVLYNEMKRRLPYNFLLEDLNCSDYLSDKYCEMVMRSKKNKIKHRFDYLKSMIQKDDANDYEI